MAEIDPEDILKDMDEDSLALICENIGVRFNSKKKEVQKSQLVSALVEQVQQIGMNKVLMVMKVKHLHKLMDLIDPKLKEVKEDERKYPTKAMMQKSVVEHLEKGGWKVKAFWEGYSQEVLRYVCMDVDELKEKDIGDVPKATLLGGIMNNVNLFGINHLLQTLNVEELKEICKKMDLVVESASKDILVDSIIEKKNLIKKNQKRRRRNHLKKSQI